jgi:hypothetical protein
MSYEIDLAHEADMRELKREQLMADFGHLTDEELLEECGLLQWEEQDEWDEEYPPEDDWRWGEED